MKKLAVLTSGGDAPGMNACVRAVVRTAVASGVEIWGVCCGYQGLIEGKFVKLGLRDVGNVIQNGGTFLKTSRSEEFTTYEGRVKAYNNLKEKGIDTLVVIGGNGSLTGALEFSALGVSVIGIPGTIDNDLGYTDFTIGFDTAVNTVTNLLNNVRDTSSAHDRVCVVEVMGRNCGDIALYSGLSAGAEVVMIPEVKTNFEDVIKKLKNSAQTGKKSSIVVVAEGAARASDVADEIQKRTGLESKAVVIGHLQRGGSPSMADRVLASRMGVTAVELALESKEKLSVAIGTNKGEIKVWDLGKALKVKNVFDSRTFEINNKISI